MELSADRANSVRRALDKYNVNPNRVKRISGKADQSLLDNKNPGSPRNRRIDILLVRQKKNRE